MDTAQPTPPAHLEAAASRAAIPFQHLHGRALLLARSAYLFLVILALGFFLVSISPRFQMRTWGDIGVRAEQTGTGEVVLSPIQGLAADEAGVSQGDVLVSVDGVPVQSGRPLIIQLKHLLGPVATPVNVEVRTSSGALRQVSVTRDSRGLEALGLPLGEVALPHLAIDIVLVLGFCLPALVIYWRKSRDGLALFVSLVLVLMAFANTSAAAMLVLAPEVEGVAIDVVLVVTYLLWFVYNLSAFLLFLVFPNGRLVPAWTRFLVPVIVVWSALLSLPLPVSLWAWPYSLVDLSLTAVCMYAQIYRYRHVSSHQERQQTKWVVLGLGWVLLGSYAPLWALAAFPSLFESSTVVVRLAFIYQVFVSSLLLLALPLTFVVSILRYRLYDVDLIINRTLVYGPLTAIMAGVFAASTGIAQKAFLALTGERSDAAVVLSTIVVVTSFAPIKDHLQALVSRYFRETPDPGRKLHAYADQVRRRVFAVDARQIARRFLEEVVTAFQARSGAVYLVSDGIHDPVHATRDWNGEVQLDLPLPGRSDQGRLGSIALGPRANGRGYSEDDLTLLGEVAQVVGAAIEEDQSVLRPRHGLDRAA